MRSLVWFRRDLRILGNTALIRAAEESLHGIVGLFVITPLQWKRHDDAACKVKFWLDSLARLSASLASLQIPLRVETVDSFDDVPDCVVAVAEKCRCTAVYMNREYEINESRRDSKVLEKCQENGIEVYSPHDRLIVPPNEILTKKGKPYTVFTPFRRVWDTKALDFVYADTTPQKQAALDIEPTAIPTKIAGFDFTNIREDLWTAGEVEAQKRLREFTRKLDTYAADRDIPSKAGTSLLSPYLAAGVLSPRQCLSAAVAANNGKIAGAEGPTTWIAELAWRDFYAHVMAGFPRVSMNMPFKLKSVDLKWRLDQDDFDAWKQGRTGFPIVDAGMRQLKHTGWMHNRLRMVTAMFLTKNLLIHWQWGERFFMQELIDGDLAANNGGWQWSASTGTDSVPYFRIFNPFSQSKRFDPEGSFIKKFCPELGAVPGSSLHDPDKLSSVIREMNLDYPKFIVDYKQSRERALQAFRSTA